MESRPDTYTNVRSQTQPHLTSMQELERLNQLTDAGFSAQIVLVDDPDGQTKEAIMVIFATPLGVRLHFLHDLKPVT